jgi:hypothetical protein
MQLSQTGRDKNPLQTRIPDITPSLIRNYAVKVRQWELRAGGSKLSAARGLREIM